MSLSPTLFQPPLFWRWSHLLVALALIAAALSFTRPVYAATFIVTKTADSNDGVCTVDCSLREAIIAANADSGADIIALPAGTYALTLTGQNEDSAATGDLDIAGSLIVSRSAEGGVRESKTIARPIMPDSADYWSRGFSWIALPDWLKPRLQPRPKRDCLVEIDIIQRKGAMSQEAFEQFRQIVLQEVALQERLRVTMDHRSFIDLVVRLGADRGCHFTAEDVEAAMRASQRAWIERWI
jgi:CSLREA domain-containing protein